MRTLLTIIAAAALVSACGPTTDPTAQPATTTDPTALWDSCTLTDDVLEQAKLLPETKNENQHFEGWHLCSWRSEDEWYHVGVYSSDQDLDSYMQNAEKSDFRRVTVDGRQGWTYTQQLGIPAKDQCSLVLPTQFGAVDFAAIKYSPRDHPEADMCGILLSHVEQLLPAVPD